MTLRRPHPSIASAALAVLASVLTTIALPSPAQPLAEVRNSIGMRFVPIAAGSFLMGAVDHDPQAAPHEKPRHRVTIARPFHIATHELTRAQWGAVMGTSPYTGARSNPFFDLPGMAARIDRPDHPATVSWIEAQEFIRRLNQKEGHQRYRLPTEAEWEYAARAGTNSVYSFGDEARQLGRFAWFGEGFGSGSTHPVGRKPANPWGLHDVHGNVWEWVQDWYAADTYSRGDATDPVGPAAGTHRVVRGGSWHTTGDGWRSSARRDYAPDYRGISIGLRLVMAAEAGLPASTVLAPAQPAQQQTLLRAGSLPSAQGPAANFTGQVRVDPVFAATPEVPYGTAFVTFQPGARSAWHTHPAGQRFVVTAGVGRTGAWGGPVVEIRVGDAVWCPPGVKHWHGAAPDSAMTHLALSGQKDGHSVVWMEQVSDAQYGP